MNKDMYDSAIKLVKENKVKLIRETKNTMTWKVKEYEVIWQRRKPMICTCQAEIYNNMCKHKLATLFYYFITHFN